MKFFQRLTLLFLMTITIVSGLVPTPFPVGQPQIVEAAPATLSCYDPDESGDGYTCDGTEAYFDENGIFSISAENNLDELNGVVFSESIGLNPGGLLYRTDASAGDDDQSGFETISINDGCDAGSGFWESSTDLGFSLSSREVTIANPEINLEAEALCEEQMNGENQAFHITLIVNLPEPADDFINLDSFIVEILRDGLIVAEYGPFRMAIDRGASSGITTFLVEDEDLTTGDTYEICFLGAEDNYCESVEKTQSVQTYEYEVDNLEELIVSGNYGVNLQDRKELCKSAAYNLIFTFIICPAIEMSFQAIDWMYTGLLVSLLVVDPLSDSADPNSTEAALYDIWNSIRIIANILFFAVLLAAITGQSLAGFQVFSAYEIKRILPRLVIGLIGIQLSWYIVGFMVDIFNVMGSAIRGLMLAPIEGITEGINLKFDDIWKQIAATIGISGSIAAGFLFLRGGLITGLPLILTPIILGLMLVILTLAARRIIIILLIISSPLAFVAWILPNTAGLYRKWWEYLWKALIMYPLILMLLASGELMSRIITAGNTGAPGTQESVLETVISMIVLFAPYFMIPLTFQFAGSLLSQVANGFSQRSKGVSEKLWGDGVRDKDKLRYKRKETMRAARGRFRERQGRWGYGGNGAVQNWGAAGTTKKRKAVGKAANIGRRGIGWLATRSDRNIADDYATRVREKKKQFQAEARSGQDKNWRAILGPKSLDTGNDLGVENHNVAAHNRQKGNIDYASVDAALEMFIGKANNFEDLENQYDRFINDPENYGAGLDDEEREKHLRNLYEKYRSVHPDAIYRNIGVGGDFQMSSDLKEQHRFLDDMNGRRLNQGTRRIKDSGWKGAQDVFSNVKDIHEEASAKAAAAGGGNWQDHLSDQQRSLVTSAARFRGGMNQYHGDRGTPISNAAYDDFHGTIRRKQDKDGNDASEYSFLNDVDINR